jgi:hypothetical protein
MLQETVSYTDFDGDPQVETLHFHLGRTDIFELLPYEERIRELSEMFDGPERTMTSEEIREVYQVLEKLVELSYGIRSDDGKHFRKSPDIYADFRSTAVFDAFMFGMFEDPAKAVNFMVKIMPKEMLDEESIAEARKAAGVVDVELPEEKPELTAVDQEVPAWVREDRAPTKAEQANMSREELLLAFQRKNQAPTE